MLQRSPGRRAALSRTLLPLLLLLAPGSLVAQDRGHFVVLQGPDTLAEESAERDGVMELSGTLVRKRQDVGERVRYRAGLLDDESTPLIELSVWRMEDPEESPARQTVRVIFKEDSVAVDEANRWGGLTTRVMATEPSAIPYFAGSTALLELITRRAAHASTASLGVPVFNLGGGQTVEGRVDRLTGDSVRVSIGFVEYRLRVDREGRILGGAAPAQGVSLVRVEP